MTVDKKNGDLQTKKTFTDFQLHLEYRIPANITGTGQARGNSGIFLAASPGAPVDTNCRYWIITTTLLM